MKKTLAVVFVSLIATVTMAAQTSSNSVVLWKTIAGVITAPGTSNPVGGIASGSSPWTTTGGFAFVNLMTGEVAFNVQGLVINGGNVTGTPGPVANVAGALVCNAASSPTVTETSPVTLSAQGDASFSGTLSSPPSSCTNPIFLIRVPGGPWIATGAVRTP
jgi:hypothetical protein